MRLARYVLLNLNGAAAPGRIRVKYRWGIRIAGQLLPRSGGHDDGRVLAIMEIRVSGLCISNSVMPKAVGSCRPLAAPATQLPTIRFGARTA